jgi:hypothetical protein
MRRIIFSLVISLIFLASCTGVRTMTKGLENEAYLEFVSSSNYSNGIDVVLDETLTFKANVVKGTAKRPKGEVYAVSTGKHHISVKYKNEIIFSKQIFVSAQETKQIILP